MRKLLTCSTALSVALSSFHTLPARAQTLADDGSVLGPDGAVLCVPTDEAACDLDAIVKQLTAEAEARAAEEAAAAEAAAQAETEAAAAAAAQAEAEAQAAAEAAAAEAAAQAEAEAKAAEEAQAAAEAAAAEAAAQVEAEAKAAEEAQAAADAAAAEAAAQAEAEAKAAEEAQAAADAAAAEAAAQAEAEAKAAEEAQAAAEAQAAEEAQAAAEAAAQAEAEAKAAEEAQAAADAAEAAAQAEAEAKAQEAQAAAEEPAATEEPAAVEEPTVTEQPETEEPAAEQPVAEQPATDEAPAAGEAVVADEPAVQEAEAQEPPVATEPVDVPEVSEEAAASLSDILSAPATDEAAPAEEAAAEPVAEPALPVAAAADPDATADEGGTAPNPEVPPAQPVAVTETVVTEADTRTSDEEFEAAPVAVSEGKKSGLSDLEKVGLLALGALVVGAIINEGKKDERRVVSNSGDRVVVENPDGTYVIYKDDDAILRRPGVRTVTETYKDGSTRTVVQRADGTEVVTIRDASGRVLRRVAYDRAGNPIVLIDDLAPEERIDITELPKPKPDRVTISTADEDAALKAELAALEAEGLGRKFSLRQIREIREVRALAATIEVDNITFDTGSSAIRATEARKLADIGRLMQELLAANPAEVFLIEGHTDAVGSAASNLSLSDRRAESLALALTEYFDIPPENLVIQGYGEAELKVDSQGDERANRRVTVRLITPLMRVAELR
jgi:outer membrane protein OmpA-like peptidoglycan-associated protein